MSENSTVLTYTLSDVPHVEFNHDPPTPHRINVPEQLRGVTLHFSIAGEDVRVIPIEECSRDIVRHVLWVINSPEHNPNKLFTEPKG